MKTIVMRSAVLIATLLAGFNLYAQGTAFTYQGRLNGVSGPANGNYDFAFSLYDAASGGNLLKGPMTNSAVAVSNGLFTATIDFGGTVFDGNARWVEIAVSTNGAGAFFTLSPRQAFTPTPYSITAATITGPVPAAQITGTIPSSSLAGTYNNPVTLNNANNQFAGSYSGDGAGVTNVNAATLGGLASSNFWQTGGNNVSAGQFIGSTNNAKLELRANGKRVAVYSASVSDSPNIIGGAPSNNIDAGVQGAVIAGGGTTNFLGFNSPNSIGADFSAIIGGSGNAIWTGADHAFIGGGWGNLISSNSYQGAIAGGQGNIVSNGTYAAIAGGFVNRIYGGDYGTIAGGWENLVTNSYGTIGGGYINLAGNFATVGGGYQNIASGRGAVVAGGGIDASPGRNLATGDGSAIGGGSFNTASALLATVVGGNNNQATNQFATVAGGQFNLAGGTHSFAAGRKAVAAHNGSFVWADETDSPFSTTGANQFVVRASAGVGINTNNPNGNALNVAGNVNATSFSGNGGGVTNLNAAQLTGTVPDGQLSGTYNGALTLANAANSFNGNGLSISGNKTGGWGNSVATINNNSTAANASPALRVVAGGGTADGALSVSSQGTGLIARFGNAGAFVADITTNGTFEGTGFSGNGSALTSLNASQLSSGTLPDARLAGTYSSAVSFGNASDSFTGNFNVSATGNLRLNDRAMYLRGGGDGNHGLAYSGNGVTNFGGGNVQVDGPVLWGYSGGALGVASGGQRSIVKWDTGGVNVSGNLSANNTPGVNYNQYTGESVHITSTPTGLGSEGNYKPATGAFVINAYIEGDFNGNVLYLFLYDVSGSTPVLLTQSSGVGTSGGGYVGGSISLSWVVPINSPGGYQNFALYAQTDSGDSYIYRHNLTVMYFPRINN
jgi:hypothetical protein